MDLERVAELLRQLGEELKSDNDKAEAKEAFRALIPNQFESLTVRKQNERTN